MEKETSGLKFSIKGIFLNQICVVCDCGLRYHEQGLKINFEKFDEKKISRYGQLE